jgi:tetratricopeptide (TPR) repeat protein
LGLTAWCAFRRPAWGFLGGWFFLILAPTSSVVPIRDLAFEHRMYLPLAAVAVAAVVGGYELFLRLEAAGRLTPERRRFWAFGTAAACTAALGIATFLRNDVHATEASLWADTVAKAPHNWRAHVHLGNALRKDRPDLALRHYRLAVQLNPGCSEAHNNLGGMLARVRPELAIRHYRKALELKPNNADAHNNLANALARQGRFDEAIGHYRRTLRLQPEHAEARANMKIVLAVQLRRDAAAQP